MIFFSIARVLRTLRKISKPVAVIAVLAALFMPVTSQATVNGSMYWYLGAALRLSGADRYETATKVSEYEFGGGDEVSHFVVASGENFPDALVAGPLASLLNAPLILTRHNSLPEVARKNIKWAFDGVADAAPDVYLIGGKNAVSDLVVEQLESIHPNIGVMRIAGQNRSLTAMQVAEQFQLASGLPNAIFITNGDQFADALVASGPASDRGINYDLSPILLNSSRDELSADLRAWLETRIGQLQSITLVGGSAVLAPAVLQAISDIASSKGVTPLIQQVGGLNRYQTSTDIAHVFYDSKNVSSVGVASGEQFPDALIGGQDSGKAFINSNQQVFLLTRSESLDPNTQNFLETNKDDLTTGVVYGGPAAVSEQVLQAIESYL